MAAPFELFALPKPALRKVLEALDCEERRECEERWRLAACKLRRSPAAAAATAPAHRCCRRATPSPCSERLPLVSRGWAESFRAEPLASTQLTVHMGKLSGCPSWQQTLAARGRHTEELTLHTGKPGGSGHAGRSGYDECEDFGRCAVSSVGFLSGGCECGSVLFVSNGNSPHEQSHHTPLTALQRGRRRGGAQRC